MNAELLYTNSLGLCLICTAFLFILNLKDWKPNYINCLSLAYIFTMICTASDMIWIWIDGNPNLIFWNNLLNVIEFSCFGITAYLWYLYCLPSFPFRFLQKKGAKIAASIPTVIATLLIMSSPFTGWVFTTADGVYARGPLFPVQQSGYLYLLFCSISALIYYKKTNLFIKKERFLCITFFPIPSVILGLFQLLLPPACLPTLQFSVFLSLLFVFVNEQRQKITRDSLTKLVNRYEFERLLNDRISHYRNEDDKLIFVIAGDIDNFKSINDSFGHLEGNNALVTLSSILYAASDTYGATVARLYGDEFCFLLESKAPDAPKLLIRDVYKALEDYNAVHTKYRISISLGYAQYVVPMTLPEILNQADKAMYAEKESKRKKILS